MTNKEVFDTSTDEDVVLENFGYQQGKELINSELQNMIEHVTDFLQS